MTSLKNKKILLTGASGFLGTHVKSKLIHAGCAKDNLSTPTSSEQNLKLWSACLKATYKKDIVIHLAANIGGIGYNKEKPGEIFYDNVIMGTQLMEAARLNNVKKFVAVGTVCEYPKNASIPFKEKELWNGYPEEVTAPYGIAKKALWVQGKAYYDQYKFKSIFLLPVNLYGPGDHFETKYSHVMPALIKKVVEAKNKNKKSVTVWGSGRATREFLYVEDAADAIILATKKYEKIDPVNLGSSREISIKELIKLICKICNYQGEIIWDKSKPDGVLRRKVNTTKAKKEFGFKSTTSLEKGISATVKWYTESLQK